MRSHEWMVIVSFRLTEDEVLEAHRGGTLALDPEKVSREDIPPPFCYQCERLWIDVHDKPCSGDPIAARVANEMALEAGALEDFRRR